MSQASQYRRPSDVDFCQREAVALRRAAMREALNSKSDFGFAGSVVAIGFAAAATISAPEVLTQGSDAHRTFVNA